MTERANQATAYASLRLLVLGCGSILIVLFLVLAVAAQKIDCVGHMLNCCSEPAQTGGEDGSDKTSTTLTSGSKAATDSIWVKLDVVFSSLHFVPPGGVKEVRQTAFGGMMTIVFLVAVLALSAQLAVDNLTVVYTTSIVGEVPAWDPRGTYRLTVRAHGIGFETCNSSVMTITSSASDWTSVGGNITLAWSATGTDSSLDGGEADGSCTVMWTCKDCTHMRISESSVTLSAPSRAWGTYVEYTIEVPQLTSSATSGEASSLPVFAVQVCKCVALFSFVQFPL